MLQRRVNANGSNVEGSNRYAVIRLWRCRQQVACQRLTGVGVGAAGGVGLGGGGGGVCGTEPMVT